MKSKPSQKLSSEPFDVLRLGAINLSQLIHQDLGDHKRQSRRYRIPYLLELLCARSAKNKIVGKRLTPRSLSDSKGSALTYVRVDIIVAVFTKVGHYRRAWPLQPLHSKPINKLISVFVFRPQLAARLWPQCL